MTKKVNELAFFNYLNKCYDEKQTIAESVNITFRPALLAVGITNEDKIQCYIENIVKERTQNVDNTINFLLQFVEEVPEVVTQVEGE